MNKNTKIIAVLGIVGAISIASLAILYLSLPKKSSGDGDGDNGGLVGQPPGRIIIYVNWTIATSLTYDLAQYELDIESMGFTAETYGIPNGYDVATLKALIKTEYQSSKGLVGVVLVGEMPYALARNLDAYAQSWDFPCDLYLMDMDGSWTDENGDTVWNVIPGASNEHNAGSGDIYPEIWVARISFQNIPGINYVDEYKKFFNRSHAYRNGSLSRPHKALLYIDNDWSAYKDEWISNFTAYTGSQLNCYATDSNTNATNYLNNLTLNYELVHVMVHGNSSGHGFGVEVSPPIYSAVEGLVNYTNINDTQKQPLFYNLYSCYVCNYTMPTELGSYYLVGNNTLGVIGCTRSGGMCLYQPFYDHLKNGGIMGEGFRIWFENPDIITFNHWAEVYGMVFLGDPVLKVV